MMKLAVVVLLLLPLLRGWHRSYWIGIPLVGEVSGWIGLVVLAQFMPVIFAGILLPIAYTFWKKKNLNKVLLTRAIFLTAGMYLISIAYYAIRIYYYWSQNEVSRRLLWPVSDYYFFKVSEYAKPYLLYIGIGIVIGLFFYILYRVTQGRVMEQNEALLGVFLGMIHGPERIVYVLILAFAITVVWFLIQKLRKADVFTLRVTPGLFIASYLVLLFFW